MKTLLIALLFGATTALAQVAAVVSDPVLTHTLVNVNVSQLAQWAEAIKRYEMQIQKQIEQIEQFRELVKVQNAVNVKIGDWKAAIEGARSIHLRVKELTRDLGADWETWVKIDAESNPLDFTGDGLYAPVNVFTDGGGRVEFDFERFRRFAPLDTMLTDIRKTAVEFDAKRKAILADIATAAEEAANAQTEAETVKAATRLDALQAVLKDLHDERAARAQHALAQVALLEAQEKKEEAAARIVADADAKEDLNELAGVEIGGRTLR